MKKNVKYLSKTLLLTTISLPAVAQTFIAQGSDLLMGTGPQAIGMAGATVAHISGVYASYWNPAGLTANEGSQISVSHQTGFNLEPISFVGISSTTTLNLKKPLHLSYAFAWIPRLHVKASGQFEEDDFETLFLRFALPEIPQNFSGETRSKTRDFRIALALAPKNSRQWSLGLSASFVRCVSSFCGSTLNNPDSGYSADTDATAFAINLGAQFRILDNLNAGLMFKDVATTLVVNTNVIEGGIEQNSNFESEFPKDISLGISWTGISKLVLNSDYQFLFGKYGGYSINIQLIRGGLSYNFHPVTLRAGVMLPVILNTGFESDLKKDLPAPFLPTIGVGLHYKKLKFDGSIYPHPIISYHKQTISPVAETSITLNF